MTTVCVAEDRPTEEVGIRLLLVSIRLHWPEVKVVLYRPDPNDDLVRWLKGFRNVEVIPSCPTGANSWNCKPHALLPLLESGHSEVIWLDSDIILSRSCRSLFAGLSPETLVITEEQVSSRQQGTECRTRGWCLPVGRPRSVSVNTCVLRVTRHHIPLLKKWIEFLSRDEYRSAQKQPLAERPVHLLSDQDVLGALVGSQEFATVPVHCIRRGVDIIHSGGALAYSFGERVRGLFGPIPPFIHGQGAKPWWMFDPAAGLTGRFWTMRRLLQEVSPYMALARKLRGEVGLPMAWLDRPSMFGRICRAIGFGHFALRGMPITAVATAVNCTTRAFRRLR